MPTFATPLDRDKIDLLMQPALIRVIDNIRKQLDDASWQGDYEEDLSWPEGTSDEQKADYARLKKQLHGVPPEEHDRVAALISQLPQPSPSYRLRLTKAGQQDQTVDIWSLCYQICAIPLEGSAIAPSLDEDVPLQADDRLLSDEGDIDWVEIDAKAKAIIHDIFKNLPT